MRNANSKITLLKELIINDELQNPLSKEEYMKRVKLEDEELLDTYRDEYPDLVAEIEATKEFKGYREKRMSKLVLCRRNLKWPVSWRGKMIDFSPL